jgi:hydroxylamine dehydrogenase
MKTLIALWLSFFVATAGVWASEAPISDATQACLDCHASLNPGIVASWKRSRHAATTPASAMKQPKIERRISVEKLDEGLSGHAVGCAECHTLNPLKHADTFDHSDFQVHVVVTPKDCATCHPVEEAQFEKNLMSKAHVNLMNNPLYVSAVEAINGIQTLEDMKTVLQPPDEETNADACLFCHGTVVQVKGKRLVESDYGEMKLPVLKGWPNRGVGRINPDESMGACSACHTRHEFSIVMARKPYTCSECHKGPDVPAYPVYEVSKHGNIFNALRKDWDFTAVPWKAGKDFTAPTCAVCHVSLVVNDDGEIVSERTHEMADRIAWRLFGVIYAHAHPKSPDTSIIKNKSGLPLATELTGEPASEYLIDTAEQERRLGRMKKSCLACHSSGWAAGHFDRFENTIMTTNRMTLTATQLMIKAWDRELAAGLAQKDNLFNEALEKKWMEQWLFYANSTRLASAMAGGDYGVFANGRYYLSKNIQEMLDWILFKSNLQRK